MMIKRFILTILVMHVTLLNVSAQKVIQKNSTELNKILEKDKKIVILDVRTPEEFTAGHLKDAINIDIRQQDFYTKFDKLNRKVVYLVYCRTNHRSGMAVDYMKQKGFTTIYQMMDGFPGWASNNLALEK